MPKTLVKTDSRGWFLDAADPNGKRVRKQDGDEIFDNIVEAQSAMAVLEKAHGQTDNGKAEPQSVIGPTGKILVGKTVTIKCKWRGCQNTRVVKTQDRFQVKYCVEHQKEHRREVLRQKRRAKTAERRAQREAAKAAR